MTRSDGSAWYYSYLPHGMAGGATSALIPLFAYALGGNLWEVGLIAAVTSIASVPAFVLWGYLSDRLRRRKVFLLIGFLGGAGSLAAMAASGTILELSLANLLIGFLGAASAPVGAVLVMETAERRMWPARLARLSRMGGIGWTAGLALGVVWLGVGSDLFGSLPAMRALFVLGAALSAAGAAFAAWSLREPLVTVDRRAVDVVDHHMRIERVRYLPFRLLHFFDLRNHRSRVPLPRPLRVYLGSVFLLFTGFTAFYGFFPIFLRDALTLSGTDVFVVYLASHVTSVVAYARTGAWVASRGSRPVQIHAALGRAALFPSFFVLAIVPLPFLARYGALLALHAGVGLCWAVLNVAGSTLVSRLADEKGHARAMGTYNAMQAFGAILGPLLGGAVAQVGGYGAAFAASVAFVLLGVAVLAVDRVQEA